MADINFRFLADTIAAVEYHNKEKQDYTTGLSHISWIELFLGNETEANPIAIVLIYDQVSNDVKDNTASGFIQA